MVAPWRFHNPVHITKSHITGKSFIADFADWARTYKNNNGVMCFFEVSSLFTNLPLDETIQICLDKLYALDFLMRQH